MGRSGEQHSTIIVDLTRHFGQYCSPDWNTGFPLAVLIEWNGSLKDAGEFKWEFGGRIRGDFLKDFVPVQWVRHGLTFNGSIHDVLIKGKPRHAYHPRWTIDSPHDAAASMLNSHSDLNNHDRTASASAFEFYDTPGITMGSSFSSHVVADYDFSLNVYDVNTLGTLTPQKKRFSGPSDPPARLEIHWQFHRSYP